MLVLAVNKQQRGTVKELEKDFIQITDNRTGEVIKVCVTKDRGNQIRLGFVASQDYSIVRSEVLEKQQPKESKEVS